MGIIEDLGNPTGVQIREWKLSVLDSINNIIALRISLELQRDNMQDNTDFTDVDREEMDSLLGEIEQAVTEI